MARQFLLFTLYAPMGSHGDVAVGERRMSWDRPARSAVFGLLAAALGIDRSDDAAHAALNERLWYAVCSEAVGRPFTDYHTTQAPGARRNRRFATRREELAAPSLNTILSVREWRADLLHTIVLWPRAADETAGAGDLERLAAALHTPHFTLYVGRKAGPLGWPLRPAVIPAPDLRDAYDHYRAQRTEKQRSLEEELQSRLRANGRVSLVFDADAMGQGAPAACDRIVVRRDQPVSRTRWQFAERREAVIDQFEPPGARP